MSLNIPKPGAGKDFPPTPAGTKPCLLVDVVDLGVVETKFGHKDMVRLVFQTPDTYEHEYEGEKSTRSHLVGQRYNKSLHEKATLTKTVQALLGRKIKASDFGSDGFDLEQFVGSKGALVQIVHNEDSEGRVWGNIESIMALPDGMTPPTRDMGYTRVKDRDESAPF